MPPLPANRNRATAGKPVKANAAIPIGSKTYIPQGQKDNITEALRYLAMPISKLVADPENARIHPERNLLAIMQSLDLFGQVKPLVMRKQGNIVIAGNGTLEAAKLLGWTKLAVTPVDMDHARAAGYGVADNRSAELARWKIEVVSRIERLIDEDEELRKVGLPGWTYNEIKALRQGWTPPPLPAEEDGTRPEEDDGEPTRAEDGELSLNVWFSAEQCEIVERAVDIVQQQDPNEETDAAAALHLICKEWLDARTEES